MCGIDSPRLSSAPSVRVTLDGSGEEHDVHVTPAASCGPLLAEGSVLHLSSAPASDGATPWGRTLKILRSGTCLSVIL